MSYVLKRYMAASTSCAKFCREFNATHVLKMSEGPDAGTGGVATFVSKEKFPQHDVRENFAICGRVLAIDIADRSFPERC